MAQYRQRQPRSRPCIGTAACSAYGCREKHVRGDSSQPQRDQNPGRGAYGPPLHAVLRTGVLCVLSTMLARVGGARGQQVDDDSWGSNTPSHDKGEEGESTRNVDFALAVEAWLPYFLGGILVFAIFGWCGINVCRTLRQLDLEEEQERANNVKGSRSSAPVRPGYKKRLTTIYSGECSGGSPTEGRTNNNNTLHFWDVEAARGSSKKSSSNSSSNNRNNNSNNSNNNNKKCSSNSSSSNNDNSNINNNNRNNNSNNNSNNNNKKCSSSNSSSSTTNDSTNNNKSNKKSSSSSSSSNTTTTTTTTTTNNNNSNKNNNNNSNSNNNNNNNNSNAGAIVGTLRSLGTAFPTIAFEGGELQGKKAPGETGDLYQNPLSKHADVVGESKKGVAREYSAKSFSSATGSGFERSQPSEAVNTLTNRRKKLPPLPTAKSNKNSSGHRPTSSATSLEYQTRRPGVAQSRRPMASSTKVSIGRIYLDGSDGSAGSDGDGGDGGKGSGVGVGGALFIDGKGYTEGARAEETDHIPEGESPTAL